MPYNNPRMFDFLLEGIGWSWSDEELDRLDKLARAHYTGGPLAKLEAAVDRQRRLLRERGGRRDVPPPPVASSTSPEERMMDEIAAAQSVAEVDHLRFEVHGLFAEGSPERARLERILDVRRLALGSRAAG